MKITRNMIRCRKCGDIIESRYTHDYIFCSCGAIAVDGGHDYLKRSYRDSNDDYEELSIYCENDDDLKLVFDI